MTEELKGAESNALDQRLCPGQLTTGMDTWRLVMEACADAVFLCTEQGSIVDANEVAINTFMADSDRLYQRQLAKVICPGNTRDALRLEVETLFRNVRVTGRPETLKTTGCRPGGIDLPIKITVAKLKQESPVYLAAYVQDVTQQQLADTFAVGQRDILEMISSNKDLSYILDAVTRLIENQLPGALCSILMLNDQMRLHTLAAPNLPAAYSAAINGSEIGEAAGSCGTAAYRGTPVIVSDIETDPLWTDYSQLAREHGLRSCWSVPMVGSDGRVLGTFAVYYKQPHEPTPEEMQTVTAVGHLAALAIANQQAEDALRNSEHRIRNLLESSQDANYRCDLLQGKIDYVSAAILPITGYPVEEFLALGVEGLMASIHPEDRPLVDLVIKRVNDGSLRYGNVEYRLKAKDGSYRWINDRFTTIRSETGIPQYWVGSLQEIHARKLMEEMLQDSNERYCQQQQALTRLTRSQVLQTVDLKDTLEEITETVAALLTVQRVSVWRFSRNRTQLECHELYDAPLQEHSSGEVLREQDFPIYFQSLAETELISADNAWNDPRTADFAEKYLKGAGITSMLGAPLQLGGALEGVLCLEHAGPMRQWQYDEQTFVLSIANLVSLILAQWELSHAEEAVRVSEANLANAQRIARLGSWTWNLQTGEQFWSDEVYELLGVHRDETAPAHEIWARRVHPDDLTKVTALIEKCCSECTRYECEYRVIHSDGTQIVLQEQAEVTCERDGRPLMLTGTILDITARKRAEEKLVHDAMHDALTGLANRKLISDHAGIAFHLFQRHNDRRFALIMADLDRFKNVNDTLGHQMGDRVLQVTAHRIGEAVRAGDTVARLGGDEFAILLEDIDDEETPTRVAQRILESMEEPIVIGDTVIDVGISMGVVVITPDHTSTEQVFRDADIALYRAKDAGRGAYQVFDQEMHRRILDRLNLEADLRHAIEREQLHLYLQPIVSLGSGQIVAFEALLRWILPDRGFISPAVFIPIAEETKQIVYIGNWVAWRACEILREWPGGSPPPISINVSPVQLLSTMSCQVPEPRGLARHWDHDIAVIAEASGVNPSLLGIEVTEGVFIEDPVYTGKLLDAVAAKGFKLLLDDFGTGYSSLSYLQDLPFSKVKLDGAFTAKLQVGTRSHELMRGIVTLAHNIGLQVIAEGVETEEQLELLRSAGCDHAQGYLFSPPLPVDAAQELYRSGRKW